MIFLDYFWLYAHKYGKLHDLAGKLLCFAFGAVNRQKSPRY